MTEEERPVKKAAVKKTTTRKRAPAKKTAAKKTAAKKAAVKKTTTRKTVRKAPDKSVEKLLLEAVEGGDNLEILKTERLLIVKTMLDPELDVRDLTQLLMSMSRVDAAIIKLEGAKESLEEQEERGIELDDTLRDMMLKIQPQVDFGGDGVDEFLTIEEGESGTD